VKSNAVENTGTIAAGNDLNLTAQDIASTGTLGAGIQTDGTVGTAGNLNLTAQNQLAANGSNLAAGNLTMQAGNINLQGASRYSGKQGTITAVAGNIDNTKGIVQSKNTLNLSANNLINQSGTINAAGNARISSGINHVAMSGGCMHNRRLTRLLRSGLEEEGFTVYAHRQVSPGDGGLSYGQAAIAAAVLSGKS